MKADVGPPCVQSAFKVPPLASCSRPSWGVKEQRFSDDEDANLIPSLAKLPTYRAENYIVKVNLPSNRLPFILTLNTADVKNNGRRMKTTPERIIWRFNSVTGSIFHWISEQPEIEENTDNFQ